MKFSLESTEPWPYQRCYCSICRKTGGSGGYMINLGGDARTLEVEGEAHVRTYHAMLDRGGKQVQSGHGRRFCVKCGSHLWAAHERWPDLVHPVASAIDTPLPSPPAHVHMMVGSKAPWVQIEGTPDDERFDEYPEHSLAHWHEAHGWSDRA